MKSSETAPATGIRAALEHARRRLALYVQPGVDSRDDEALKQIDAALAQLDKAEVWWRWKTGARHLLHDPRTDEPASWVDAERVRVIPEPPLKESETPEEEPTDDRKD